MPIERQRETRTDIHRGTVRKSDGDKKKEMKRVREEGMEGQRKKTRVGGIGGVYDH